MFNQAVKELPYGVEYDPMAMKTIQDLQWSCILQLDLINEGQDSAKGIDPQPIRQWLKKYGYPK